MEIKKIVFLSIILITTNVLAADHVYDVSGYDDNGNYVYGEVEANNGERDISGTLFDDNGNIIDIDGQWNGYGQIDAEDMEGNSFDLETD